jgi:hypothetical protein
MTVGGRGVWLLLVLDFLRFRSSPANKEAARSGSSRVASHVLLPQKVESEKGDSGSYASTSVRHPWQDPASAGPAPSTPYSSCCSKLHVWCYVEALVVLGTPLRCLTAWSLEFFNRGLMPVALPGPYILWPNGGPRPGVLPPLEALFYLALELDVAAPPSGPSPEVPSRPALVVLRRIGERPKLLPL